MLFVATYEKMRIIPQFLETRAHKNVKNKTLL